MLTLLRSVGGATRAGSIIPPVVGRAIASNSNLFPYSTTNSSNHVRNYRKLRVVPNNADYSAIKLTYANFMAVNGGESVSALTDITVRAGIEYDGVFYPVTFSGSRDVTLTAGSYQESDEVVGLTLPAGAKFYERVRMVGQTGTQARVYSHTSQNFLNEGQIAGTDTAIDYTLGGEGDGATATATVSGGSITGFSITNGGSNYTSSPSLFAYEVLPDGTLKTQGVGYAIRSGDTITNAVITNGGSGWTNPTLVFAGGSGFGQSTAVYAACLITGQPNVAVNSLLLIGDSIARGVGSSDGIGDIDANHGIFERAAANRFGVGNISAIGNTAAGHINLSAREKMYNIYGNLPTHVLLQNGTNDFSMGSTNASVTNNNETIAGIWRGRGADISYATILPRTSSSDGWTTLGNQTEVTGHGIGSPAQNYNSDLIGGNITSDWNIVDASSVTADASQNTKWRIDQASALTADGTHPANLGLPYISSQIENYFNVLA